jgi:hypothetical protein
MSDESTKRLHELEFRRGRLDGEQNNPPQVLTGAYMDGYAEGREHARHRTLTPGGMPAFKESAAPRTPVAVPPRVIERLSVHLIDPLHVLAQPAAAWGGKSALDHVREGGTWDEVMQAFERLFSLSR